MAIEELLTRISDLLDANGEAGWAQAFRKFLSDYKSAPGLAKREMRAVYGGMGSFNDIILHGPDGIPLRDENDALDQMRSELFELILRA